MATQKLVNRIRSLGKNQLTNIYPLGKPKGSGLGLWIFRRPNQEYDQELINTGQASLI